LIALAASAIGCLGALIYFLRRGSFELSLWEVRAQVVEAYRTAAVESTIEGMAFTLLTPFHLLALFVAVRSRIRAATWAAVIIASSASVLLIAYSQGGRAEAKAFLLFTIVMLTIHNWSYILARKAKLTVSALLIGVILFAGNAVFTYVRGGIEDTSRAHTYMRMVSRGDALASAIGIGELPSYAAYALVELYQYCGTPIYYLHYYAAAEKPFLGFGSSQFPRVLRVVQTLSGWGPEGDIRIATDNSYNELGIAGNVWGTALRDVVADFGEDGYWVGILLWMVVFRHVRTKQAVSGSYELLYALMVSWIIWSPFESLLRVGVFEMALYYSVAMVFAEELVVRSTIRLRLA
jgi:hypothetical protein